MKHYVVMLDWATNDDFHSEVIGVGHTLDEAKSLLSQRLVQEIMFAEKHDYKIETNTDTEFVAYEDGFYSGEHTHLWIEEVEN